MTWKEFKHQVEEQGVLDEYVIDYIDVQPDVSSWNKFLIEKSESLTETRIGIMD